MNLEYVATCLLGVEGLVKDELKEIGAKNIQPQNGRVFFEGDERILIRANLYSRFAERILIHMGSFKAFSFEELFDKTINLPWETIIEKDGAFPVKGSSLNSKLSSVPACQSIIKKAIVKRLQSKYDVPWFTESGAEFKVQFLIMKDNVSLMIDTSGAGLHKRGYRQNSIIAPIKETLAATMVKLARVNRYSRLIDPMCGSGTILIEGAMMALNIAPGLSRRFISQRWKLIPKQLWEEERAYAKTQINYDVEFEGIGYDIDNEAVKLTLENAKKAGVDSKIKVEQADFKDFNLKWDKAKVICNPPYGERLMDIDEAQRLYKLMGDKFKTHRGYSYYVISPDEDFESYFYRKADKRRKLYNGMIKCQFYMYFK